MFCRLNLNRIESIVFNLVQPFYIEVNRLAIRRVDVIVFIDAEDISVFGYTGDLDNR